VRMRRWLVAGGWVSSVGLLGTPGSFGLVHVLLGVSRCVACLVRRDAGRGGARAPRGWRLSCVWFFVRRCCVAGERVLLDLFPGDGPADRGCRRGVLS
jgi:hypothetical protein